MKRMIRWVALSACFFLLAVLPLSGDVFPSQPQRPIPDPQKPEEKLEAPHIWRCAPGTIGDWNSPGNWTNGLPGEWATDVIVDVGGIAEISSDAMVTGTLYVATARAGTIEHIKGANTVDQLIMAAGRGSVAAYNLGGEGNLAAREEFVGILGTAVFSQTAGVNSAGLLKVGGAGGAKGAYNLGGNGALGVGKLYIGTGGAGVFNHTGGTVAAQHVWCGGSRAGCAYNISGAAELSAGDVQLGDPANPATGQFTQLGGTVKIGRLTIRSGFTYFCKRGSLEVQSLEIEKGGVLDVDFDKMDSCGIAGDSSKKLQEYIADGRICDSARDYPPNSVLTALMAAYDKEKNLSTFIPGKGGEKKIPVTSWDGLPTEPGLWSDSGNWTNATPTEDVIAQLNNGGTAAIVKTAECFVFTLGRLPQELIRENELKEEKGDEQPAHDAKAKMGGTCNLSGGSLLCRLEYIGNGTEGIFNHSAGENVASVAMYIRGSGGADVRYTLRDEAKLWVGHTLYIGDQGQGMLNQSGGIADVEMALFVDGVPKNGAAYDLAHDARLIVKRVAYVGLNASSVFNQTGGTNDVGGVLYVDAGAYNLGGHGKLTAGNFIYVAGDGDQAKDSAPSECSFNQTSGKAATQCLYVGGGECVASYNIGGDALLTAETICIGLTGGEQPNRRIPHDGVHGAPVNPDALDEQDQGEQVNPHRSRSYARQPGAFCQVGGTVRADYLFITSGSYLYLRGTLEISRLVIGANGRLDIDTRKVTSFKIPGNEETLLNGYITDGKIVDSTLENAGDLRAVYDARSGCTTLVQNIQPPPTVQRPTTWRFKLQTAGAWEDGKNWSVGVPGRELDALVGNGGIAEINGNAYSHITSLGGTRPSEINQLAGVNSLDLLYIGEGRNYTGTYRFSGGELAAQNEYIGYRGTGALRHDDGTNFVAQSLHLGFEEKSSGAYDIAGGFLAVAHSIYSGTGGSGAFTQGGESGVMANAMNLGFLPGAKGNYKLKGKAILSIEHTLYVGNGGTGVFEQDGGLDRVGGALCVGDAKGSAYNLTEDSILYVGKVLYLGYNGSGAFDQTGGANDIGMAMYVDAPSSGNGVYSLSGGGMLRVKVALYVGCRSKGVLDQTGGKAVVYGAVFVGDADTSGVYKLSGKGELRAQELYLGYGGKRNEAGLFVQKGGTCGLQSLIIRNEGKYQMKGGTLKVRSLVIDGEGQLDVNVRQMDLLVFQGDQTQLLRFYIDDGRICDSSLSDRYALHPVYDAKSNTTTLATIDFTPATPPHPVDQSEFGAPGAMDTGPEIANDYRTDKFAPDRDFVLADGTLTAHEEKVSGHTFTQTGGTNRCGGNMTLTAEEESECWPKVIILGGNAVIGGVHIEQFPDNSPDRYGLWHQLGGTIRVTGEMYLGTGDPNDKDPVSAVANILGGTLEVGGLVITNALVHLDPVRANFTIVGDKVKKMEEYIASGKLIIVGGVSVEVVYDRASNRTLFKPKQQ